MRSTFIILHLISGLFSLVWALSEKPNIIIIIADDLGFNDVGFHGSEVRTPNIDALAGHGIILNRHYAQPCCTPSRAALMTAKYPIRIGMQGLPVRAGSNKSIPLEEKMFPEYFKELGYKSHIVGKWHLGFNSWAHVPTNRGFDSFFGFLNGGVGYYDGVFTEWGASGRDFRRNEKPVWEEVYGKYLTDVISKEASSVIEKHEGQGGLLLFVSHASPHKGNLDFLREAPPHNENFTERAVLAEMVRSLDDSVGSIVSSLNKKGLINNTIIVFMSDNGAPTEDTIYGYYNRGSNWPLRGIKLSIHDGALRTPAFIWSPALRQPRISTDLFHITDWLPTLYTAAGGPSTLRKRVDGISHWHSMLSGVPGPRNEVLLNIDEVWNNEALIQGKWKIVKNNAPETVQAYLDKYYGVSGRDEPYNPAEVENSVAGMILGKPPLPYDEVRNQASLNEVCLDTSSAEGADCHSKYCLYDIMADSTECRDRSLEFPQVVAELESKLAAYRKIMVPTQNNSVDPRAHPILWDDYWTPWLTSHVPMIKPSLFLITAILLSLTIAS